MIPDTDATGGWRRQEPWMAALEIFDDAGPWAATARATRDGKRLARLATPRSVTLRIARRYAVPAKRVFAAWLDPEVAGQWLFATALRPLAHVEIDARVGGAFRFVDRQDDADSTQYVGEYVEIDRPRRLVFTFSTTKYSNAETCVTVEIVALAKGCRLTVTHENVPREHAEDTQGRWTGVLYGLGATLDSASTFDDRDQE